MEEKRKQFVKYYFYKLDVLWRRFPVTEKEERKREFPSVLDELSSEVSILSYPLVGICGDCGFLLWKGAWDLEHLQDPVPHPLRTQLG